MSSSPFRAETWIKHGAEVVLGTAFFGAFLLPIFLMVPGHTEAPDAAAAGSCYARNHGHLYPVDCWRWHIAHWCERVFLALLLLASLQLAGRGVVRMARWLFADSSRASS